MNSHECTYFTAAIHKMSILNYSDYNDYIDYTDALMSELKNTIECIEI